MLKPLLSMMIPITILVSMHRVVPPMSMLTEALMDFLTDLMLMCVVSKLKQMLQQSPMELQVSISPRRSLRELVPLPRRARRSLVVLLPLNQVDQLLEAYKRSLLSSQLEMKWMVRLLPSLPRTVR